ncbi:MAG: hypothetical protein JGK24_22615 [Microcoleus sp. PH2017_29_MFU_D_A]|jgi:hypothetical protein|uniref:hypothetical protein n=1 Tax=unclassified Microcoleus TaxID=2642155 RepID=UPI001DB4B38D|nr:MULTISPECIES: hypothetical protein [unclassified Microcoleus]MCC3419357.1 hypothetical protein [Microcoleus sp. PH2017_07_MST_O_A]MCC3504567.1 hypothetical protein [Microcoleus sp. PH2017_19_SFW_U_A]MCC3510471.1 hypothetical protein [Microcoleus sp. PH2017_17_BER_D_A]TAE39804.1 MAG: hypothetical protein EAZ90_22145 [Oscillatoriales cyanobacterium]MCC3457180.1 hypothetical protein [Microcoleus sp. PH2017_08_TRC_O_A]
MFKIARLEKIRLSPSHRAIKTNKLLLKYKFYSLKVFEQIYLIPAIARSGEAHSETLIERVKISWPIAIASCKNAGTFRLEAGGR